LVQLTLRGLFRTHLESELWHGELELKEVNRLIVPESGESQRNCLSRSILFGIFVCSYCQ